MRFLPAFLLTAAIAYAHGTEQGEADGSGIVLTSFIILLVLIGISYTGKEHIKEKGKIIIFSLIVLLVIATTAYIAAGTVLKNIESATGGPVHWHADFEIWTCGEKVDIEDPMGFENRVGTPVFHEHGDDRIHVEGTLRQLNEASLHEFFEVIGGALEAGRIAVATNDGVEEFVNGQACNGNPAKVQVFLYKTEGETYAQQKLEDFENYVISPYPNVPPGDCIIIEFSEEKEETDRMCASYRIAEQNGEISEG
ncbi:MAG: hypothetical protein HYW25_01390 [Candidatus Aenigmarchaeota archaeon]|nr:hypothetical protein [Candidatus Aenigmarchaeota archaeon]